MNDLQIQAQAYGYFLAEAPELLLTIEQEILILPNEHTTSRVHSLMRALHTLKGAAANVGLKTIERISHDFEDITRVFYNLDVEIDLSIQSLLLDGYTGLQECVDGLVQGREIDESEIGSRLAVTIDSLKALLGDWMDAEVSLPTAMELGFDIVASIFETTVQEQLEAIEMAITAQDPAEIEAVIQTAAEICIGLGESFELPGFVAINQVAMEAIRLHPDLLEPIALLALNNLREAVGIVLAGDRATGGTVHPDLLALTQLPATESLLTEQSEFDGDWSIEPHPTETMEFDSDWSMDAPLTEPVVAAPEFEETRAIASGEAELPAFRAFLTSAKFRTRNGISTDTQNLFDGILRLAWDWFAQSVDTPATELSLELLITSDGLADADYLHHWVRLLLAGLKKPSDTLSLQLYRASCVYQVVFAVAKYLAEMQPLHQITPEFLTELRSTLQSTVVEYKQQPPATLSDRGWLDRIILPHHWQPTAPTTEDALISEIWGQTAPLSASNLDSEASQTLLIEIYHRSIQHHEQIKQLYTEHRTTELEELSTTAGLIAADLAIVLEKSSNIV